MYVYTEYFKKCDTSSMMPGMCVTIPVVSFSKYINYPVHMMHFSKSISISPPLSGAENMYVSLNFGATTTVALQRSLQRLE